MASSRQSNVPAATARWINNPPIDLIIGCGAWTLPLLLLTAGVAVPLRTWSVTFYLLAFVVNYPHYMATVYRAYHTSSAFTKYRLFTVHITGALALLAVASHAWAPLLPWVFTLYITWSPWHYTAQNFGLTMMFARRNGVAPTRRERPRLYAAFLTSYALLFVSLHTSTSGDPLIRSLGIPSAAAAPAQWILLLAASLLGVTTIVPMVRRAGLAAMAAPLALVSTQVLWFVVPVLVTGLGAGQPAQTRYGTGVLAVMHSLQYLWIARYHARREAEASTGSWHPWAYAVTLVGGGIALFVPWPWVTSYVFGIDFTESLLIVTAIVNIHHFVLDGAIWKLRDRQVAAMLVGAEPQASPSTLESVSVGRQATRWLIGDSTWSRGIRVGALCALALWAGLDQVRFIWGTNAASAAALDRAALLNPHDSSVLRRQARLALEQRRYQDADARFRQILAKYPQDPEALISAGLLAAQLGNEEEAERRWNAASAAESSAGMARRLLAQLWATRADRLDAEGRAADAAHAFQRALSLDEQNGDAAQLGADWFNYAQFLKRRLAEPSLVLACLMRAEELLANKADTRVDTVRSARAAMEREFPTAIAEVRGSAGSLLEAARTRF